MPFGDYGWLQKIFWALLDLVTIVASANGLYLWIGRRKRFLVETNRK